LASVRIVRAVFPAARHPLLRRLWFSVGLTVIGTIALAVLGDWLLAVVALVMLVFELRTLHRVGGRLAASEQPPRD
jgi:hypothetical protein